MKKHTYKLDQLVKLRKLALDIGLDNAEILNNFNLSELQGMANGIGSENMPSWMRGFVSLLNPTLESVAFIHDVEWSLPDKNKSHFKKTNKRFRDNGYKCAKYFHGWWNPRRYMVMRTAKVFAKICQMFGWRAYKSGKMNDYTCDNAELNYESID